MLAAKPKVGKSTLIRTLILDVARGEPFLGRATTKGSVVYLCLKDHRGEVRKAFRKLGATADDPIRVCFTGADPSKAVRGLQELIAKYDPVLVVVDTIGKFLDADDFNDYVKVSRAFAPILAVLRETRCHALFTHHANKVHRGTGDDVLGSTAFFGNIDTLISMEKRSRGTRTASAEQQRYGADLPSTELAMNSETERITAANEAATPATSPDDRIKADILKLLATGDMTRTKIRDHVQGRNEDIAEALDATVAAGKVGEVLVNKKTRRYSLASQVGRTKLTVPGTNVSGNVSRERGHGDRGFVPGSHPIEEPKAGTESDDERAFRDVLGTISDEVWRACQDDNAA